MTIDAAPAELPEIPRSPVDARNEYDRGLWPGYADPRTQQPALADEHVHGYLGDEYDGAPYCPVDDCSWNTQPAT